MTEGAGDIRSVTDRLSDALRSAAAQDTPLPKAGLYRRGLRKVSAARRSAARRRSVVEEGYRRAERSIIPETRRLRRVQIRHLLGLRLAVVFLWFRAHWVGLSVIALLLMAYWWRATLIGWVQGAVVGIMGLMTGAMP